jgi:death on curing protein
MELVKAIHLSVLNEHGGLAGGVEESALAATLARPLQLLHYAKPKPSIYALAASYGYGIARNHCFADGNKRVSLMTIYTFLAINNMEFNAPEPEAVLMIQDLAAGRLSEAELAAWIKLRAIKFEKI